jgi:hypothetical protein
METKEPNKVQDYFNKIFVHDLPDKDFEELKRLVIDWLNQKANGNTKQNKN